MTICNQNHFTTKYAYELANGTSYKDFINYLNYDLSEDERAKTVHSLDDILFDCTFNGKSCTSKNFLVEYDNANGYCYTFNSGYDSSGQVIPLKESTRAGSKYGLRVTLYANIYENLKDNYLNYLGGVIFVGNSSYKTIGSGRDLSAGMKTSIIVERYFER